MFHFCVVFISICIVECGGGQKSTFPLLNNLYTFTYGLYPVYPHVIGICAFVGLFRSWTQTPAFLIVGPIIC